MTDQPNVRNSGYDFVNRNVLSRVRNIARDGAYVTSGGRQFTPEGHKPKMLGCQQWSGEPKAERGSRYININYKIIRL